MFHLTNQIGQCHPPPTDICREYAADKRTQHGTNSHWHVQQAKIESSFYSTCHIRYNHFDRDVQPSPTDALDDSTDNEYLDRWSSTNDGSPMPKNEIRFFFFFFSLEQDVFVQVSVSYRKGNWKNSSLQSNCEGAQGY